MEILSLTTAMQPFTAMQAVNNNLMFSVIKNFQIFCEILRGNIFMKILQLWEFFISYFSCLLTFQFFSLLSQWKTSSLLSFHFICLMKFSSSRSHSVLEVRECYWGIFNLTFLKWKSFYFFRYIWVERDLCMEVPSCFYFQFSP